MTQEDIERWEGYYREACAKDFARRIYEETDREDADRAAVESKEEA